MYNRPPLCCRVGVSWSRKTPRCGTVGAGNSSALVPLSCWVSVGSPWGQGWDIASWQSHGLITSARSPSEALTNPSPALGLSWLWPSECSIFTCQGRHPVPQNKTSPTCAQHHQAPFLPTSQPSLAEAMASGFVLRQHHIWGWSGATSEATEPWFSESSVKALDSSHMGWLCDFVAGKVNGQHQGDWIISTVMGVWSRMIWPESRIF